MKYINSAATAIGIILTKNIMQKAGVQNVNAKHHVLKYVTNINLDKRMKASIRDYYPKSIYKLPEPMEMMIPTPKDFGQYLQQKKRNRRRKK